ncbi:unnamed protein product [Vitrella brassicaformis CCMP3155]|uniref:SET domain-containing protein n=1 Tax=Vitrella brassicaformis (strain CCMP3155) TaxID=1169540 RepID=A0A0G4E9I1_VITBC|nr:unnamed protein product [Vitrella brassicaformis CCMP3155]|eukprot:CEL91884.1 unnamed protein product [Vitrella brassicaformis CCMP3155]
MEDQRSYGRISGFAEAYLLPRTAARARGKHRSLIRGQLQDSSRGEKGPTKASILCDDGPAWQPALIDWICANGGRVGDAVECRTEALNDGKSLRGLMAMRPIEGQRVIAEVPLTCCVSSDESMFLETPLAAAVVETSSEKLKAMPWHSRMAIALLYERRKGPASMFAPWLESLPEPPTLPVDWPEELVRLAGSEELEVMVDEQSVYTAELYMDIQDLFESLPQQLRSQVEFPEEEFRAAHRLVTTRTMRLPLDREPLRAVVPLIDLANHNDKPNCHFQLNDAKDAVQLIYTGEVPLQPPCQLTIDYGVEGGEAECLGKYGFLPPLGESEGHCDDVLGLGELFRLCCGADWRKLDEKSVADLLDRLEAVDSVSGDDECGEARDWLLRWSRRRIRRAFVA